MDRWMELRRDGTTSITRFDYEATEIHGPKLRAIIRLISSVFMLSYRLQPIAATSLHIDNRIL